MAIQVQPLMIEMRWTKPVGASGSARVVSRTENTLLAIPKVDPDGDTKLDNVLIYLEHLSRHLGTIESIRGLQGPVGSSAR